MQYNILIAVTNTQRAVTSFVRRQCLIVEPHFAKEGHKVATKNGGLFCVPSTWLGSASSIKWIDNTQRDLGGSEGGKLLADGPGDGSEPII